MKTKKVLAKINKQDVVHIMGIGAGYYGGYVRGACAILQIGNLNNLQKLGSKVIKKNIDEDSPKSYILFSDSKAIDNLIGKLQEMKKLTKKRKKK